MSCCRLSFVTRETPRPKKKQVHIAGTKKDYMSTDISEGDARKKNRALKAKYSTLLDVDVVGDKCKTRLQMMRIVQRGDMTIH